jgi:hypothetical protein
VSSTDIYLPLDDIVGCKDGKVFASCNSGKKIITINTLGNGKTFIRTDYCTRGLALDEKGNCMVCLTEKAAILAGYCMSLLLRDVLICLPDETQETQLSTLDDVSKKAAFSVRHTIQHLEDK